MKLILIQLEDNSWVWLNPEQILSISNLTTQMTITTTDGKELLVKTPFDKIMAMGEITLAT